MTLAVVIDDDDVALGVTAAYLDVMGLEVVPFTRPAQGIAWMTTNQSDLVVCDVLMPEVDGFATCVAIRQTARNTDVPIILLTALGRADDLVRGIDAGADEFLTKPVEPLVLRARIQALLRRTRRAPVAPPDRPTDIASLLRERRRRVADDAGLTAREAEVLDLIVLGRSHEDIGRELGISARTARFHQDNLLTKLGAESRVDLLRILL